MSAALHVALAMERDAVACKAEHRPPPRFTSFHPRAQFLHYWTSGFQ